MMLVLFLACLTSRQKSKSTFSTPFTNCKDGICVDPPLCRGPPQGIYKLRVIGLVCEGEIVGKIREVDELGEKELVLVVSVRCGKE